MCPSGADRGGCYAGEADRAGPPRSSGRRARVRAPQWLPVPRIVLPDRTQQRTVVHTSDIPDPQGVEELAETLCQAVSPARPGPRVGHEGARQQHKKTGKIRFMLRDEKTMNIVGNIDVVDDSWCRELTQFAGSERGWIWWAVDSSDGEPKAESLH